MVTIKEMPYKEKYAGVLFYYQILEGFAPRLVKEELGEKKVAELREIWKKESEPIPEGASDQDRYEIAYRNFMKNWVSAHNFMREYRDEVGATRFLQEAVLGWHHRYSGDARLLKLVGSVSRKTAFQSLAKQLAYKLQVFSPFVVSELNGNRMVLTVNPCKIPGMPAGSDFCSLACQNIIPHWLESQFKIIMNPTRHGANCAVTFEPL